MGKIVVVYGGGFQPFHAGHFSSYIQAKEKFGQYPNAEFYVTASDNTNTRPIPFKEKQWLAKQAGVGEQDFRNVAVKSPLNPIEILNQYNPDEDIFILVRSERDPVSYNRKDGSPGYYQPFVSIDKCKPFNSQKGGHGYVFVTQKEEFVLVGKTVYSGTQVRDIYANADNATRNRIVKDMYPNSPNELMIRKVLDKYIGTTDAMSTAPKANNTVKPKTSAIKQLKAKKLKEQIQRMRPLLKEASIEQKYKLLKLIKEATQLDELNLFKKKKPEPVKVEPNTSPNDYHAYFNKPEIKKQKVYRNPEEYMDATKKDPLTDKKVVDELNLFGKKPKPPIKPVEEPDDYRKFFNREPVSLYEPQDVKHYHNSRDYHEKTGVNPLLKKQPVQEYASGPSGNGGNYFQALASAWYNGAFNTGSLQKGIKSKQDIERLLQRGVLCPDNVTRKFNIDYNSDFDGVVIYSDDYYEHGDHDDTIDSRTGQKWGPYDFMEFSDDELDESLNEFAAPGGDDNEPDEEEILFRLAKQWWLGTEQDMIRVERTLASMGWEIGEDEGSYDDGGVFVVRAGDVNGDSYQSWPHEDLIVDEGQTSDMRNFFSTQQPLNPAPIQPTTTGPTIATVTRQGESVAEDYLPEK